MTPTEQAADRVKALVENLREMVRTDHLRGCEGREYECSCGHIDRQDEMMLEAADALTALLSEIQALRERVEGAEASGDRPFKIACDHQEDAKTLKFLLALIAAGAEVNATRLDLARHARDAWKAAVAESDARARAAEAERDALREGLATHGEAIRQGLASVASAPCYNDRSDSQTLSTVLGMIDAVRSDVEALLSSPPLGNEGEQGDMGLKIGSPKSEDAEMKKFLDGVVGLVEADSYASHMLWDENRRRARPKTWEAHSPGLLETVGHLGDMPVCISLFKATVDGHKLLFWHATSVVVDHRMIRAWMKEALPATAFREDGYPNSVDANNFPNVFRRPNPVSPDLSGPQGTEAALSATDEPLLLASQNKDADHG